MSDSIIKQEEISTPELFQKRRESLKEILHLASKVETPQRVMKKMGDKKDSVNWKDLEYPEFSYMLAQFREFHPHYKIEMEPIDLATGTKVGWITVCVHITDLQTGEVRPGVDSKQIAVSKENGTVIDLGNTIKGAYTEALRKGFSEFGVCADIYKRIESLPPNDEQTREYEKIVSQVKSYVEGLDFATQLSQIARWNKYLAGCDDGWNKITESEADEFINSIKQTFTKETKGK